MRIFRIKGSSGVVQDDCSARPVQAGEQLTRRSILKVATLKDSLLTTRYQSSRASSAAGSTEGNSESDGTEVSGPARSGAPASVRFSSLEIRLYKVIPETNPSVSMGPAIGLDWSYEALPSMPIDEYEERRPPRLDIDDVLMHWMERLKILREAGASPEEIYEATRRSDQAREERDMTFRNMKNEATEVMRETFVRGVRQALHIQKSDASEQKLLWKKAQVMV